MSAVLTRSAAFNFQRVELLLTDHVDILCESLQIRNVSYDEAGNDTTEMKEEDEDCPPSNHASLYFASGECDKGLKRKRESES